MEAEKIISKLLARAGLMDLATRDLLVVAILSVAIPMSTQPTFACSCARMDPDEMLARTEAAFVGRVVSKIDPPKERMSSWDPVIYTFVVDSVAKGSLPDLVVVRSENSGASCGFEGGIPKSDQWGILLRHDDDGNYKSGLCSTISPGDLLTVAEFTEPDPSPIHRWLPIFSNLVRRVFFDYAYRLGVMFHRN